MIRNNKYMVKNKEKGLVHILLFFRERIGLAVRFLLSDMEPTFEFLLAQRVKPVIK